MSASESSPSGSSGGPPGGPDGPPGRPLHGTVGPFPGGAGTVAPPEPVAPAPEGLDPADFNAPSAHLGLEPCLRAAGSPSGSGRPRFFRSGVEYLPSTTGGAPPRRGSSPPGAPAPEITLGNGTYDRPLGETMIRLRSDGTRSAGLAVAATYGFGLVPALVAPVPAPTDPGFGRFWITGTGGGLNPLGDREVSPRPVGPASALLPSRALTWRLPEDGPFTLVDLARRGCVALTGTLRGIASGFGFDEGCGGAVEPSPPHPLADPLRLGWLCDGA